jgi:SNF2 family DNA or RNA helicase
LRNEGFLNNINEYLKILTAYIDRQDFEIYIKGKSLKEYVFEEVNFRFSIQPSQRKSYLELEMEIFNKQEKLIAPPPAFKIFLNDNGFLSSFRTKNDSYTFIKALIESLDQDSTEYKKHMYSSGKKDSLQKWVEHITGRDELYFMDSHHDAIYQLPTNIIKTIIKSLFQCFQETAARFSFYDPNNKVSYFQIPKNQLFNGIADFHKIMSPLGYPIFYNKQEIKSWSSNIRFERRKSNLDWFELDLVINEKDLEVIKNADLGENYLLTNQGLVLLDTEEKELLKFMKKYTGHETKEQSQISGSQVKKFSLNFKRARIFELFELKKHGIDGALTQEEEVLCKNLLDLKEMPSFDIPQRYKEIAREYQLTGYNWLRFLFQNKFGACLADDMGLGKTLQTIMFIQSIIDQVDKVLIVCPVSILINWQNEIEKFSDLDVDVYYGSTRTEPADKKIILTSYGVMKKESYTTFNDMRFDILVMDEVQHLKNIRSQGASAARNLHANFRVCLTGTPVENDLSEFYNIMDLSIPGIWGEISFLKTTSTKKSRLLARKTVRPFILRRTKEQVLTELPEKVENHVFLNFKDEEREHYIGTLAQIRHKMANIQQGRKYGEILKSLLQLRQLCLWQNQKFMQSTKIEFLLETLGQILEENHKAIVFSQFTTYLDIIQDKVREQGWKYTRIDGSQSFKKRAEQVDLFQKGDAQVFLISLKAGGVGLNLTAASYIFLMDPWWNPAVENQAIDRAHRIGQENKLTVYRPIIKDSVEEKVMVLQNAKKELFKDLMADDDEGFYNGKLTMDDFQMLLS